MSEYITLLNDVAVNTEAPNTYLTVKYAYERSGSDMKYKIYCYARLSSSQAYRNDSAGLQLKLDDVEVYNNTTWKPSGSNRWPVSFEQTFTVSNKTSGNTKLYVHFWDTQGSSVGLNYSRTWTDLIVSAAGSTLGTITAGRTLSGPTINVTKYDSNFVDNITLTYNNRTITRSNFTSSKLVFSEAERLLIFQAQGAGQTKGWTLSGTTYSGQSALGTYTGTVNISTEALAAVTNVSTLNVESNLNVSVSNACGATWDIKAYAGPNNTYECFSATSQTGTWSNASKAVGSSTIYSSNTTSKTGSLYWVVQNKISGTSIGSTTYTSSYSFVQSLCGPTMNTLTYKVTDAGTIALLGASGTAHNYNDNTDLGKFIKGKTTLTLVVGGTANTSKNATVSKYNITVPGQTITSSSNTTYTTRVLSYSGTILATVVDSRGFESSALQFSYTLNDYITPAVNSFTAQRFPKSATITDQDKHVKVSFEGVAPSYILQNNSFQVYYRFRESGTNNWTNVTSDLTKSSCTISGNSISITDYQLDPNDSTLFDTSKQYDIQIVLVDYYSATAYSVIVQVPISAPLIARRLKRIGINKIPDIGYALDVSGKIRSDNSIESGSYINAGTSVQAGTYVATNGKTSATDSVSGEFLRGYGTIDIVAERYEHATINFYYQNSSTPTSQIAENSSGILTIPNKIIINSNGDLISLTNGTASTNTWIKATRTDTNNSVSFGVGSGGVNRGLYDNTLSKWMVYSDASDTYLNGRASEVKRTNFESDNGQRVELLFSGSNADGGGQVYTTHGLGVWTRKGRTTVTGRAEMVLGNDIASGTADNKDGTIRLFTQGTGSNYIATATAHNSTYWNYLPAAEGTLALAPVELWTGSVKSYSYASVSNLSTYKKLAVTCSIYDQTSADTGGVSNIVWVDLTKKQDSRWCRAGVCIPYSSNHLSSGNAHSTFFSACIEADLTDNRVYCLFTYNGSVKNDNTYVMTKIEGYLQ